MLALPATLLLAGREFSDTDAQRPVSIVNQRLVERFGLTPHAIIGRRISFGLYTAEVTGVVSDVRFGNVADEIEPQIFLPPSEGIMWIGSATFYVRSARPPQELFNDVREAVARVDPTRPITSLHTVEQQFRANIATERFVAGTSTAFAVLATALAALVSPACLPTPSRSDRGILPARVVQQMPVDRVTRKLQVLPHAIQLDAGNGCHPCVA